MTKEKYENKEYNPFMYPAVIARWDHENGAIGGTDITIDRGITLFDHYVGQIIQGSIYGLATADLNADFISCDSYTTAEYLLDNRAKMLGIEVPE